MKTHPLVKILIVVVLLAVVTWSSLRAYAAWHYRIARATTTELIESGQVGPTKLQQAETHIAKALRYFPRHPGYLQLSGRTHELRANQPGVVGKAFREEIEKAATDYRKALSSRPLWPYNWSSLLRVKDRLGQVDNELRLALRQSVAYGPWERAVQKQVLTSGLRHWDDLGVAEQALVREMAMNALKVQPRYAFKVAKAYARPDLICNANMSWRPIKRWCDQVFAQKL